MLNYRFLRYFASETKNASMLYIGKRIMFRDKKQGQKHHNERCWKCDRQIVRSLVPFDPESLIRIFFKTS